MSTSIDKLFKEFDTKYTSVSRSFVAGDADKFFRAFTILHERALTNPMSDAPLDPQFAFFIQQGSHVSVLHTNNFYAVALATSLILCETKN